MDEGPVKSVLEVLPAYLDFVVGFLRSPRAAFAPYALKGKVQSDLTSFLLAGVAAAYLAAVLMPSTSVDIQSPQGGMESFARWLLRHDAKTLPLEALLAVLLLALGTHLIGKLFDRWQDNASLRGSAEDSVNAALGFASIFLPFTTILLLCALKLTTPAPHSGRTLIFITAGALVLYLLVATGFLVASFAGAHRVSWAGAASALAAAFVCIVLVAINLPY